MDSTLILSAATALAYTSPASSGALPPHFAFASAVNDGRSLRVHPPVIELSAYPVVIDEALEHVIHSSMSIDFERRYVL